MNNKIKNNKRVANLYEEVVGRIKEAIFAGEYKTGQALPSEIEMASLLGVSRPVVREAYKSLQSFGFLEIKRGTKGGAFVCDLNDLSFAENLSDLLRMRKIDVDSLVQTRMLLEPEIARLAALNATDQELDIIENLLDDYDKCEDPEQQAKINSEFHRLLGRYCGNPLYSVLLESIMDFTATFIQTIKPVSIILHDAKEHRAIFQALKHRNPTEATELICKHIDHISNQMRKLEKTYLQMAVKNQ